jgi:hypothetical protein
MGVIMQFKKTLIIPWLLPKTSNLDIYQYPIPKARAYCKSPEILLNKAEFSYISNEYKAC